MNELYIILCILIGAVVGFVFAIIVKNIDNKKNDININIDEKKYDIVYIRSAYIIDRYAYDKINIDVNKLIAQEMLNEIIKYIKFEDITNADGSIVRNGKLLIVNRNNNV